MRPSLALPLLLLAACGGEQERSAPAAAPGDAEVPRVVALGGSVAEAVYALGAGDLLVARDLSATYPAEVLRKPDVGYFRMIGAEGVLSTNPTLVLADPAAGPPEALAQLEAAGVRVVRLPGGSSPDSVKAQVRAVAAALGREEAGEAVVDSLETRLAAVAARVAAAPERPRVLFVLGQGGGALQLAGRDTNADTFIRLAGGANAFPAAEGYTAITPEAVVEAAPDVILLLERTVQVAGGLDALLGRADLQLTPAAREGRVVVLPDAALAFGPSLGAFAERFARALHPETTPSAPTAGR